MTDALMRADWYARTAPIMNDAALDENRITLLAQLAPTFAWRGRAMTDVERDDTRKCLEIVDAERAYRHNRREQA